MKRQIKTTGNIITTALLTLGLSLALINIPTPLAASGTSGGGGGGTGGGGGGGTPKVDSIQVSKCFYDAPTGQMLIKASSSDSSARLFAYRPDGTYQGEVQNGGGSRYGGTVMGYIPYDPGTMTIKSSSGGSITVPTTPFQI